MANLNSWQKITRVLPGRPFGDGADGDYNSSTIPTMTYRSCSGSSGSTTLTLTSAGFSNGDLILIHQTRGTGAGQWEMNYIFSGGGTTSLTLLKPLYYTYTDSGASQAQAVKIPRYTDVTCPSGATWTVPAWDGNTGGILVLAAKGAITITGTISANGSAGSSNLTSGDGVDGATGGGYYGGKADCTDPCDSDTTGEGTAGDRVFHSDGSPNGNGGGNGYGAAAGGGGGNGTAGGEASGYGVHGKGGNTAGAADLTNIVFGGGGGGGHDPGSAGGGGSGGGLIILIAKSFIVNNSITASGGNGGNANVTDGGAAGGGGAGGSILFVCKEATLGTNKLVAVGGSGGTGGSSGGRHGGAGGVGRIALHYSGSYSGSTNPALYANLDPSLVELVGGSFLFNFL